MSVHLSFLLLHKTKTNYDLLWQASFLCTKCCNLCSTRWSCLMETWSQDLKWNYSIHFQDGSLTWLMGGCWLKTLSVVFQVGFFMWLFELRLQKEKVDISISLKIFAIFYGSNRTRPSQNSKSRKIVPTFW
jgi:hypothetical protein